MLNWLLKNPDHFIFNIGTSYVTNDGKSTKSLVDSITKLENSLKHDSNDVAISNFITRKYRWNDKSDEANKHLPELHKKAIFLY